MAEFGPQSMIFHPSFQFVGTLSSTTKRIVLSSGILSVDLFFMFMLLHNIIFAVFVLGLNHLRHQHVLSFRMNDFSYLRVTCFFPLCSPIQQWDALNQ